jgi:hypothetical protein
MNEAAYLLHAYVLVRNTTGTVKVKHEVKASNEASMLRNIFR